MRRVELTPAQAAHLRALKNAADQARREFDLAMAALALGLTDKLGRVNFELEGDKPFLQVPEEETPDGV